MMTSTDRNFHDEPWTVAELIEELERIEDPSAIIHFTSPAGGIVPKGFSRMNETSVSLDFDNAESE